MYCHFCMQEIPEAEICPKCGHAAAVQNLPDQLSAGTLLQERYLIGRVLGCGGFGITYLGRDLLLGSRVAVKEFYPRELVGRSMEDRTAVRVTAREGSELFRQGKERFIREAQTLESLGSVDSIVHIKNIFSANDTVYIVMEYLEGQSLRELLDERGRISFSEAAAMLEPIMRGVEKLHGAGILHRDISPSNIMLLPDGSTKLLDLGAAREFEGNDRSVSIIAKSGYTPKEQYTGRNLGQWTDVYALCATVYTLITGEAPENALERIDGDRLALPSALGADVTRAEEAVLMKGLALEAKDRFQSMAELRAAMAAAASAVKPGADEELTTRGASPTAQQLMREYEAQRGDKRAPSARTGGGRAPEKTQARVSFEEGRRQLPPELPTVLEKPELPPVPEIPEQRDRSGKADGPARSGKRAAGSGRAGGKRKSKLILGIIAVLLAVGGVVAALAFSSEGDSVVTFRDKTVTEGELRALNRNKNLNTVYFKNCEVPDAAIAELRKNKTLRHISFDSCARIPDLAPLADVETLEHLSFSGTEKKPMQIDALFDRDFNCLKDLSFSYVRFGDFSFISHVPKLYSLSLDSCSGKLDLSALQEHGTLGYLTFSKLQGVDLSPLGTCRSLGKVTLRECGLSDISWIAPLTGLYSLDLSDNRISDISALRDLAGLLSLDLGGNRIVEIESLRDHVKLQRLDLGDNGIEDIGPLENCTELVTLTLSDNRISDLSACTKLIKLTELYLKGNLLTDLSGLSNTTQLEKLNLSGNEIVDISPISKNAGKLKYLGLGENRIEDLSPLRGAASLKLLAVHSNRLRTLGGLEDSTELSVLYAHSNELEDISAVSSCKKLELIDLSENRITDLSPVTASVVANQVLLAQHNRIADISCLQPLTSYRYLYLYDNPLPEFGPVGELEALNLATYVALPWSEDADYTPAFRPRCNLTLADVPLDRQMPLAELYHGQKKELEKSGTNGGNISFKTAEELDREVNKLRENMGESFY